MRILRSASTLTLTLLLACTTEAMSANGLNLSWDGCGAAGTANKNFACSYNYWSEYLVISAAFPAGLPVGNSPNFTANLAFVPGSGSLPSWWSVSGTGACRPNAILPRGYEPPGGLGACAAGYIGDGGNVSLAWSSDPLVSGRRNLVVSNPPAIGAGGTLETPGPERHLFTLEISHAKSTGAGLCNGCSTPVCIVLNSLTVTSVYAPYTPLVYITNPLQRNFVTWQGGTSGMAICPAATPARNSTWGSLKSLYH